MFTQLTFNTLFIFFPGIISIFIIVHSGNKEKNITQFEWIIYSFVLGIFSYIPISFFKEISVFKLVNDSVIKVVPLELLIVTVIAIIYSLIFIYLEKKDYFYKFLRFFNISNSIGTQNLLISVYRTNEKEIINLRDKFVRVSYLDRTLEITGFIKLYSQNNEKIELVLLKSVKKPDSRADINSDYDYEATFLSFKPNEAIIEFLKE